MTDKECLDYLIQRRGEAIGRANMLLHPLQSDSPLAMEIDALGICIKAIKGRSDG